MATLECLIDGHECVNAKEKRWNGKGSDVWERVLKWLQSASLLWHGIALQ